MEFFLDERRVSFKEKYKQNIINILRNINKNYMDGKNGELYSKDFYQTVKLVESKDNFQEFRFNTIVGQFVSELFEEFKDRSQWVNDNVIERNIEEVLIHFSYSLVSCYRNEESMIDILDNLIGVIEDNLSYELG